MTKDTPSLVAIDRGLAPAHSMFAGAGCSCGLSDQVACWLRHERALHADLAAACTADSPDAEVVRADLAAAGRTIDALIAVGRTGAAPRGTLTGAWRS